MIGENHDKINIIVKGAIIGGTMMVPGASGGTMAMILGIYDRLIRSVSGFRNHRYESVVFLLLFCAGGCLGMFILSKPVMYCMQNFKMATMYFFIGAIFGGVPMIISESKGTLLSWKRLMHISSGVLIVLLVSVIPTGYFDSQLDMNPKTAVLLAVAGFTAAAALVLPGISVSYLLLIMGLYDETMRAISQLYMPFLISIGTGTFLGIIITTKCLEKAMDRYPLAVYSIILGFVLGSVVQVFPGIPVPAELPASILSLAVGFSTIFLLSRKRKK